MLTGPTPEYAAPDLLMHVLAARPSQVAVGEPECNVVEETALICLFGAVPVRHKIAIGIQTCCKISLPAQPSTYHVGWMPFAIGKSGFPTKYKLRSSQNRNMHLHPTRFAAARLITRAGTGIRRCCSVNHLTRRHRRSVAPPHSRLSGPLPALRMNAVIFASFLNDVSYRQKGSLRLCYRRPSAASPRTVPSTMNENSVAHCATAFGISALQVPLATEIEDIVSLVILIDEKRWNRPGSKRGPCESESSIADLSISIYVTCWASDTTYHCTAAVK
jgi:hypothetical protein